MIIVLDVKVFEGTWSFSFSFFNKVLNVIITFEFGMRKRKVEGWRFVIIVK